MFSFNSKYSKVLTILLVVLIVAILGLAGYFGYDLLSASAIDKKAESAVDEFEQATSSVKKEIRKQDSNTTNEIPDYSAEIQELQESKQNEESEAASQTKVQKQYLEGYEVLGTIYIPKTKCKYPVLSQVTKKSLETAVAVLYPTNAELNVDSNVVIVGHNYRNNLFFSNNYKLSEGDKIEITSATEKVTYEIYDMFYTTPDDASYMQRDTNGAREISLSTCNDDSSQRLIILAREQGK